MVDAVAQPGAYHGMPFDMPLETHQAVMGANAVGEATAAKAYPGEEAVTATPAVLAAHKRYRAEPLSIPPAIRMQLTPTNISVLEKYGCWLRALAKRKIPPTTLAQVQFLRVANGTSEPRTKYELAWVSLSRAMQRSGGV